MDSSTEDFDFLNCVEETEEQLEYLDEISEDEPKKPHFLDYDAAAPSELHTSCFQPQLAGQSQANDLDKNNVSEKSLNSTDNPSSLHSYVTPGTGSVAATNTECISLSSVGTSRCGTKKKEVQRNTSAIPGLGSHSHKKCYSLDYDQSNVNRLRRYARLVYWFREYK